MLHPTPTRDEVYTTRSSSSSGAQLGPSATTTRNVERRPNETNANSAGAGTNARHRARQHGRHEQRGPANAHAPLHVGDPRLAVTLPRCSLTSQSGKNAVRGTDAVHERQVYGDQAHCARRIHRNAYKYVPALGDPDVGHHTPSTNFDSCHRNCAGHAKRAIVECAEWMDEKSHPGERERCRLGVVDMMRECKLYAMHSEAVEATAAVKRGDKDFNDPCDGVSYTRGTHAIRDAKPMCEVCGVSHWLRQHGVHGHTSPWKKFEWHAKPGLHTVKLHPDDAADDVAPAQPAATRAVLGHGHQRGGNDTTGTAAWSSNDAPLLGNGGGGGGGRVATNRQHVGAPPASPAEAAAADREMMFPVCETEPSSCTDACQSRVEVVMRRCMQWLHVSGARTGSSTQRVAVRKAAACESAIAAARDGCDTSEHADCVKPVADNSESLMHTIR
jgi:hypothetical protein